MRVMCAVLPTLCRMTWCWMSGFPNVFRVRAYLIASSMHTRAYRFDMAANTKRSWLKLDMIAAQKNQAMKGQKNKKDASDSVTRHTHVAAELGLQTDS